MAQLDILPRRSRPQRVARFLTRLWIIIAFLCVVGGIVAEWDRDQEQRRAAAEAQWAADCALRQPAYLKQKAEWEQKLANTKLMPRPGMIGPFASSYDAWNAAPGDLAKYHAWQDRDGWWWIPNPPNWDSYRNTNSEIDDKGHPLSALSEPQPPCAHELFRGTPAPFELSEFGFHSDIWAAALIPPLLLYAAGAVLFWAARALWK